MSLEEKFDKIFRQRVGESEFPFDESNWEKASRMIDAERGGSGWAKSSKLFLLFGAIFLGIATITFFSLTMGSDSENKSQIASNDKTNTNNNSNAAGLIALNKDDKNNSSGNAPADMGVAKNEINNNPASAISNSTNDKVENNATSNTVTTPKVNDPVNNGSVENINNNPATTTENKMASNPSKTTGKDRAEKAKTSSYAKNKPAPLGEKKTLASGSNNEILNASKEDNSKSESSDYLNMRSSILQIWKKEESIVNTAYDFIRINDEYYKGRRRKTHFLNVELGSTYLLGWETAKGKDGKGFNAFAGINYGLYLSKRTSISIGAQVYNVGNIKQAFYSKASYDYDFGSNGNYTNITTNSLYYFSVPVRAFYNIPKTGSRIGLGINTGILFNGKSTIETYTERDLVKTNVTHTSQKGTYEGVNNVNVLISALYSQRLNKRMSLNGEVMYGLSDTYNNKISGIKTKEKNIGVRLSLQFTLFDK